MAKINFGALAQNVRPTYKVDKVGNREILCSSSSGGQKSFTKSWIMQLGKEGKIDMDAELNADGSLKWEGATFKFTGDTEREF